MSQFTVNAADILNSRDSDNKATPAITGASPLLLITIGTDAQKYSFKSGTDSNGHPAAISFTDSTVWDYLTVARTTDKLLTVSLRSDAPDGELVNEGFTLYFTDTDGNEHAHDPIIPDIKPN